MTNVLVLRFSSMGDVAMTVPVLRCLVKNYPNSKITIVSKGIYRPIFIEFGNIHFFELDLQGRHKGFKGLLSLFKELKKLRPTHIADLHSVLRSNVLYFLFKINFFKIKRLSKQRGERKKLFRSKNKIFKPLTPSQFRYCEVFNRLGFNLDLTSHEFPGPLNIETETQLKINQMPTNMKWIGIAPFASFNGKIYPLDLMQKLVSFLQRDHQIFLFGQGEYEVSKLEVWTNAYQNVFGSYNLGSFESELEIISNLDLMISMDSANGHLAANYNIPVVSLWGLTHPFGGFAPFLSKTENMFISDREKYPKIPTSAYGKKIPKGYEEVMRTIDYNEVIVRCLKVLEKPKHHQSL